MGCVIVCQNDKMLCTIDVVKDQELPSKWMINKKNLLLVQLWYKSACLEIWNVCTNVWLLKSEVHFHFVKKSYLDNNYYPPNHLSLTNKKYFAKKWLHVCI